MNDNNISEKLKGLAIGKNRSATARLREIFDDVEAALHAGARRKDVHQALKECGFTFSFEGFELAIYRIRKEKGDLKNHKAPARRIHEEVHGLKSGTSNDNGTVRPPGITDAEWSEIRMKAASIQRMNS